MAGGFHRLLPLQSMALSITKVLVGVVLFGLLVHLPTTFLPEARHNGDVPKERRALTFPNPLIAVAELVIPFYRPNDYPLQEVQSFVNYNVCTDIRNEGCDQWNTIQFVNVPNPPPNGFRFHDRGPLQMQGVFWAQQESLDVIDQALGIDIFPRSELASYAQTRHGGGIQTGQLQTDQNGYEYAIRPLGDHTFSTSPNAPSIYLSGFDVLYLYDLVEGTLDNPIRFEIIFNNKIWFDCFRFSFGNLLSSVAKFEQVLVTDPNDADQLKYPGSFIWKRKDLFFSLFPRGYTVVQVVDGNGNTIEPAWSEFQKTSPRTVFSALVPDRINDYQTC